MSILLGAIFYTISTFIIMLIAVSYGIAYFLTKPKSKTILSWWIFFMSLSLIIGITSLHSWSIQFGFVISLEEFIPYRSFLLMAASVFVFYTTWFEKNGNAHISNGVIKIKAEVNRIDKNKKDKGR